jgi:hypothetical protein
MVAFVPPIPYTISAPRKGLHFFAGFFGEAYRSEDRTMNYLYRGVSKKKHLDDNGLLLPKKPGNEFTSIVQFGDQHAQFGNRLEFGNSVKNEIVKHQHAQLGIPTSGISTTPYIERAKFYTTCNGKYNDGYIYKIDRNLLQKYNVSEYIIKDEIPCPSAPEDNEVILVADNYGILPKEIIIEIEYFQL